MKINKLKKESYTAPKMKATGFKTENGYAISEPVMSTTTKITMFGSSL